MQKSIQAIVLAGGKSSRFKTGRSKLTEKICGQELILYPTRLLESCSIATHVLTGWEKESIEPLINARHEGRIQFIEQKEQKGTGHAVLCTRSAWKADSILVINGDMPLITKETIENLVKIHDANNAAVSFVTAHNPDPTLSYGRVIEKENEIKIIEAKDFEGDFNDYCCVNAGVYIFDRKFLEESIDKLTNANKAGEFYLTDLVAIANEQKLPIKTMHIPFDEIRGVNTLKELWTAEQIKRAEIISHWMERGVRFHAAQSTHIDVDVVIEKGSVIGCGAHVMEASSIGKNSKISCYAILRNATIGDNVVVNSHTMITNAQIGNDCTVGPFAHIEGNSSIDEHSTIGNFVQVKRSQLGKNNKAKHLAYIGDTIMGNNNNIGAGTITCNYDGAKKHETIIQNNCFVGSNSTLVAPVILENNSYCAAGSTITQDVPSEALAIARSRQTNKEGYAKKIKDKIAGKNENQITNVKKKVSSPSCCL